MKSRERLQWMDDAMCVALGPDRWDAQSAERRKVICHGCRVREQCLEWVIELENDTPHTTGIVAGLGSNDRRKLIRAR